MGLTRRQFLKWAGATSIGAVVFNGCRVPDHEIEIQSPIQLPEDLVTGRDNYYATTAQSGSASEGLLVRVMEGRAKKVEGNPDYPVNTGKHHIRSEALLQAAYHPDRLSEPLVRIAKGGPWRRIGWPEALDRLASLLGETDPSSVLIATAPVRGQLAQVVSSFSSAYGAKTLGFEPVDQSVLRAAVKRTFSQNALPDFDIANAGMVLSIGADFLGTWIDPTHFSRGYGEFRQGTGRDRGRLVHVDSRYSVTAAAADKWLYAKPGTEGLLALSLAEVLIREGKGDRTAADQLTGGRGASALAGFAPGNVADRVGLSADAITSLAHELADAHGGPALVIAGGSAGAHTNGVFNLSAALALNYLTGAVNKPGGVIFNPAARSSSITAAPAREWKEALDDIRAGKTSVVLVKDANIVHGLPASLGAAAALGNAGTIVSFSSFLDETTEMADLVLPGTTPLEEWGTDTPDLGPGYVTVGFQQPVINRFHNNVSFGDVLLQTAKTLDLSGDLPWGSMREAVQATARELHSTFRGSVTRATFAEFWKRALERGGWWDNTATAGSAVPAAPALPTRALPAKLAGNVETYPLHLVPFEGHGALGGQFSHLPWVQSTPDPITTIAWMTWVELNPHTADEYGLATEDVVIVESATGKTIRVAVYVNPATPPDVAAIPMGGGHRHSTSYAARKGANVLDIVVPEEDSVTGALAWAGTRVRLTKTNRRQELTKLEGIEEAIQLPGEPIILVQRANGDSAGH